MNGFKPTDSEWYRDPLTKSNSNYVSTIKTPSKTPSRFAQFLSHFLLEFASCKSSAFRLSLSLDYLQMSSVSWRKTISSESRAKFADKLRRSKLKQSKVWIPNWGDQSRSDWSSILGNPTLRRTCRAADRRKRWSNIEDNRSSSLISKCEIEMAN